MTTARTIVDATIVEPFFDFAVVEPHERIQDVPEGLHLPDQAKDTTPIEGTVISCGPECRTLREGMRILYGRYAGHEFEIGGRQLLMLRERDTLGLLR